MTQAREAMFHRGLLSSPFAPGDRREVQRSETSTYIEERINPVTISDESQLTELILKNQPRKHTVTT